MEDIVQLVPDVLANAGTDLTQLDNPVRLSTAESVVDSAAKKLLNTHCRTFSAWVDLLLHLPVTTSRTTHRVHRLHLSLALLRRLPSDSLQITITLQVRLCRIGNSRHVPMPSMRTRSAWRPALTCSYTYQRQPRGPVEAWQASNGRNATDGRRLNRTD